VVPAVPDLALALLLRAGRPERRQHVGLLVEDRPESSESALSGSPFIVSRASSRLRGFSYFGRSFRDISRVVVLFNADNPG
jgi:hypothetical protein